MIKHKFVNALTIFLIMFHALLPVNALAMTTLPDYPPGSVVTYAQIKVVLGYASGYVRALPFLLRQMAGEELPAHRVVTTDGHIVDRYVPHQRHRLTEEGVDVNPRESGTAGISGAPSA